MLGVLDLEKLEQLSEWEDLNIRKGVTQCDALIWKQ